MKSKAFYIVLLGMVITSCSDFLEVQPKDFISPANYYKTAKQAMEGVTGVYDILGQANTYGEALWYQFGASTDESFINRTYNAANAVFQLTKYNYDATNIQIRDTWRTIYDGINRANVMVEALTKADFDESQRTRMLGEVRFIRGLLYFNLAINWGDVPIRLEPIVSASNLDIPKSPVADVYKVILDDLTYAEENLPLASALDNKGRVCKGAAQGLLARVNLFMAGEPLKNVARYKDARDWALKVKNSGQHALNPDYTQIFINQCQDISELKEILFEVAFYGNRITDPYTETGRVGAINGVEDQRPTATGATTKINPYAYYNVMPRLYNWYETKDVRREWNICIYKYKVDGTKTVYATVPSPTKPGDWDRNPGKWRREYETVRPYNQNYTPTNFPVIRYADVLLMLAEAQNELTGPADALPYINEVRRRASASDIPAGLSQDQFREVIRKERSLELCFEGLRKPDLVRWGKFVTEIKAASDDLEALARKSTTPYAKFMYGIEAGTNVAEKHKYLPIPDLEISINKMITQSDAWK